MDRGGSLRGFRGTSLAPILSRNFVAPYGSKSRSLSPGYSVVPSSKRELIGCAARKTDTEPKPRVIPVQLIETYKHGGIHAVSALYQLCQALQFQLQLKETVTPANVQGLYFAFCAVIDGMEYRTGVGHTKKEARSQAAQLALGDLLPTLEPPLDGPQSPAVDEAGTGDPVSYALPACPPPLPEIEMSFSLQNVQPRMKFYARNPVDERIPEAVRQRFEKLMENYPQFFSCGSSLAAFVVQSCSGFEVVAIGTGDFNTKETVTADGRLLHDAHAVVTARRSLLRYLYRQLLMFFCKNGILREESIFKQDETTKLVNLKDNTSVHLYLNQLPKGAAQIPSHLRLNPHSISAWEVNNQIGLHVTIEGKVFSVFSSTMEQTSPRVVSMSASDKLTQWQVLGVQGALLSHFIEPIYVDSILIGDATCSSVRGLEIAVNQRVDGITGKLPTYYCVNRARVGLVPAIWPEGLVGYRALSVNWTQGDTSLEVVDGLEGRASEDSPFKSGPALASRLCKAAMLSRFNLVVKEAQRADLCATVSYRDAKMMSKSYQEAKNVLKSYLSQKSYGSWVVKSPISDSFSI
ncbi:adenosine deaminase domain-containing protein 1 [Paramormyrops kingsleyae]|uniref:Adenosine deaminase domain containing 1 (testis-specific) n=1 Tax=Paramormyrops kingsleyae TaxID=1676925 RepID=A0A3B3T2E5_9TELE|nr:adenosine deaminase domain-containing protein 1 isoform X2 [Paramormyrops kingsleyae]